MIMKTYCGIDLHSNNNVIVVIDETDKILLERKLSNNLGYDYALYTGCAIFSI